MILKGSQRSGALQLATHLMNREDNEHVALADLRGFASDDLFGAMTEVEAVTKGTKCRQPVFSLSLSPPKSASVETEQFLETVERAEKALGLSGQPRAVVIHEKDGRKHAHAVWSRIDGGLMQSINLPFFKNKLSALSKELYLENGWELPDGHKAQGWKNPLNYTLAEWQQAKRQDLDPREVKQIFADAWQRSDNLPSFRQALEERGYFLARGDRRGVVAVDLNGEIYAVSRYVGVKSKDLTAKLGSPESLPSAGAVQDQLGAQVKTQIRAFLAEDRAKKAKELLPLGEEARRMKLAHRDERLSLTSKQALRTEQENRERASRFRRGAGIVLDVLTGRLFALRKQNEREALQCRRRDVAQREQLGSTQLKERAALQKRIDTVKSRQREDRMALARQVALAVRRVRDKPPEAQRQRDRTHQLEL